MKKARGLLSIAALTAVLFLLFTVLFYVDNKYTTPPPYGRDGILSLQETDLTQGRLLFLIDGWLLSDQRTQNQPTWIGEFASLQRGNTSVSPHGQASYTLTLRYTGRPVMAAAAFEDLCSDYTISLDGSVLAQGCKNGQIFFPLTQGDHLLKVETDSQWGYYSGMYYPPALGMPDTLSKFQNTRSFAYALAFLVPLALALFTSLLWRTGGQTARYFAQLCCFFALYVSWYFVQLFHLPFAPYWFLMENVALYGLCLCVILLTALASGQMNSRAFQLIRSLMVLLSVVLLVLCLLIPAVSWAVSAHGILTNLYYIMAFCSTVYLAAHGVAKSSWENWWTLAGCTVFGAGLVCNLFFSNHFEPIRFFWQFEWCGLLMVFLFGAMMAARNRRILLENIDLTLHLDSLVDQRTRELNRVLEERKAFFSDMAHDLKAPVFATQSFISAIRKGGVGIDSELARYLNLAEAKQQEMARRLQGLSSLNALDKITGSREPISIKALLQEIYASHHSEAEVSSVHLVVLEPEEDGMVLAQMEKLELLFENLIYNALRATPPEGTITVSASLSNGLAKIKVADTGCGIPPKELPLIFQRFYVGASNKETGTGLGLYIVSAIVDELGGQISVSSTPGEGTVFWIELPLMAKEPSLSNGKSPQNSS